MKNEIDLIKYFMAAEKVHSLISAMDRLLEFCEEFKIQADEDVKKSLNPYVDKINQWIKDG